jgi:hypothetical protein
MISYDAEVLGLFDPHEVRVRLRQLAGDRVPVMCCYERVGSGQWCHRALAAAWLAEGLGIRVSEFGHEDQDQPLHPLGQREMLVP